MILCCGEALIDMIPTPTENGVDGFVPHSGGAVFNTAIALGRLDTHAGMLSGISTDMFGQQLVASLNASNVDTTHLIQSDRPSTLAFVRLVDGQATYSFYDENSAGRMVSEADLPALSSDVSTLFFGGISLACEPGAQAYACLLERESADRVVMIDPNIRPKFITDAEKYRSRLNRMMERANIIKVSDEDLNWLFPGKLSLREKVSALLEKGPSMLLLTRGEEGATGFHASGYETEVPPVPAKVVDTVGAGDTFNAGVLAMLSELGHLTKSKLAVLPVNVFKQALEYGARAAAITVTRAGANPPWTGEL